MSSGPLHLTKHHGLGNDFLVLLQPPAGGDTAALARAVCDRHRGVGADGLMIAHPGLGSADVTMELRNADGGRAEMSGNGIRCFAQAIWDAGVSDHDALAVATDAGIRIVRRVAQPRATEVLAAVDMGPAKVIDEAVDWVSGSIEAAALVEVGNPHLVLLDRDLSAVDIRARGREIEVRFPGGINVEWIWPAEPNALTLRVWERGVGATEACGTGSCAAAAAAVSWGRVRDPVLVHNPGGDLTVELGDTAVLTGPAVRVAAVEVPWP